MALADMGIHFLFIEMDVWLLKNPMAIFDTNVDIAIGQHFQNPYSLNIGFYYVKVS